MKEFPKTVQAIGIACVPMDNQERALPAFAARPVAAAIVTLRSEGGGLALQAGVSDNARDTEFPLSHLVDRALIPDAAKLVAVLDVERLTADAMARGHFDEPQLARALSQRERHLPEGIGAEDEWALCRRLDIPFRMAGYEMAAAGSSPDAVVATSGNAALINAAARLMLWAHVRAFEDGKPDAFFETMKALAAWIEADEHRQALLEDVSACRPMRRLRSLGSYYETYRAARDAGDEHARWVTFEEGLFHS